MSDVLRRIAIAAIAGSMAIAGTAMAAGTASAAPACNAPAGYSCLAINNATRDAHSFRQLLPNGATRCLTGHVPGKTRYHANVHVKNGPLLYPYKQDNCAGPRYSSFGSRTSFDGRWNIENVTG